MNNFFYSSSDYDLFKKALRTTKNEPVIINIYSDDSSLNENAEAGENIQNAQRKQMSSKFQASPFDKFFGPRKKRTDPLDMKDFSAWKNKNYRESEKHIDSAPEQTTRFSFSDYLNSRTKDKKFNSEDEIKADNQKAIDQLSTSDENYKKFSLDSYLNKLEQQTKAKKDFAETDDLVSDFVDSNSANIDFNQDENFQSSSDVGVEDIAFGTEIKGEKFAFDREELDSVKARLEKMEREANNIKDKPTTKVISTNELTDIAKEDEEDDEFNLDKLGIEDDIERVNQKLDSLNKALGITGDEETETPKVEHHKFIEIKKAFDDADESGSDSVSEEKTDTQKTSDSNAVNVSINAGSATESSSDEVNHLPAKDMSHTQKDDEIGSATNIVVASTDKTEDVSNSSQAGVVKPVPIAGAVASSDELADSTGSVYGDESNNFVDAVAMIDETEGRSNEIKKTDDILTKTDLLKFTDELVTKFSEMSKSNQPGTPSYTDIGYDPYAQQNPYTQTGAIAGVNQFVSPEMVDGNTGTDQTNIVGVVGTGQTVDQEYKKKQDELQAQLMELIEQNKKTDEEVNKKLEMAEKEKLRVAEEYENRLRELEASMQEREEAVKQQAYIEKLKNDIKFKKSENKFKLREEQIRESEKSNSQTLLDCEKLKSELRNSLSVSNLEMDKKLLECVNKLHKAEIVRKEQKVVELEQDLKEEIEKPKAKAPAKRRSSTVRSRMRTRTPRRKIDSDIIGGINFD